ncbi:hypothetical protein PR048_011559 [Dryococelus australis]|uniref:Uncharacterized protein n=1 Tax=Dryococelus australis TaxID=614101 RepID=A0ABQ9HLZ6_9NEOP|nr:hypothetical protein PR048_011559 [Dryococelus australis]
MTFGELENLVHGNDSSIVPYESGIINYPNIDEPGRDIIICLFIGDKINVAKKNIVDYNLLHSPFIVLSNKEYFQSPMACPNDKLWMENL